MNPSIDLVCIPGCSKIEARAPATGIDFLKLFVAYNVLLWTQYSHRFFIFRDPSILLQIAIWVAVYSESQTPARQAHSQQLETSLLINISIS